MRRKEEMKTRKRQRRRLICNQPVICWPLRQVLAEVWCCGDASIPYREGIMSVSFPRKRESRLIRSVAAGLSGGGVVLWGRDLPRDGSREAGRSQSGQRTYNHSFTAYATNQDTESSTHTAPDQDLPERERFICGVRLR